METVPHYVDCAIDFNNQASAFIFTIDQCVQINYEQDFIINGPKKIGDFFPSLGNKIFAAGIDAAFTTSVQNEVYIFKKNKYILFNFVSGNIIRGPEEITDGFHFFKDSIFKDGIDAAFASSQVNEAYIFKGAKYAIINYASSTVEDFWVSPPKEVLLGFNYLTPTVFKEGLDAAFSANATNEAYIFKGDTYARINYAPGPRNGFIIKPVTPIHDGFRSLKGVIPLDGPSY